MRFSTSKTLEDQQVNTLPPIRVETAIKDGLGCITFIMSETVFSDLFPDAELLEIDQRSAFYDNRLRELCSQHDRYVQEMLDPSRSSVEVELRVFDMPKSPHNNSLADLQRLSYLVHHSILQPKAISPN